jgi:hypothetical protein
MAMRKPIVVQRMARPVVEKKRRRRDGLVEGS